MLMSSFCREAVLNTVNLIRNICSLSDGPVGESTGTPYIYATPLEISFHDLKVNPQASITMSLAQVQDSLKTMKNGPFVAQGNYCTEKHYDPMDPRCAHIILTGSMVEVAKST